MSPRFWIYAVMAITITAVVVGCWSYFTRIRPSPSGCDSDEKLPV